MIINVKEQCHVICKKNEGLMLIVQVPVVPLMVFTFFYCLQIIFKFANCIYSH